MGKYWYSNGNKCLVIFLFYYTLRVMAMVKYWGIVMVISASLPLRVRVFNSQYFWGDNNGNY